MNNKKSKIVPKEKILPLEISDCIIYEKELPFPYVHYPSGRWRGAFFAFQERRNSPLFYCSCQKKGMEIYLRSRKGFSGIPVSSNEMAVQNFIQQLQFKDELCHVCNKLCPKYGYDTDNRTQTKFHSIYGYYINGLAYEYGIDVLGIILEPELIPADIVPVLITSTFNKNQLDEQSRRDFMRYCENMIRRRMGYFAIGEKWKTEIKLLELVRKIYPQYTVNHQYELDHLRADIYIEELQLIIEYQGEQHFKPIAFMGGEEGLKKIQARDKEKVELCNYYKLGIVYFDYRDELNEKAVKKRILLYLKERNTRYSFRKYTKVDRD